MSADGTLIDSLYWELALKAEGVKAGAKDVVAANESIGKSATAALAAEERLQSALNATASAAAPATTSLRNWTRAATEGTTAIEQQGAAAAAAAPEIEAIGAAGEVAAGGTAAFLSEILAFVPGAAALIGISAGLSLVVQHFRDVADAEHAAEKGAGDAGRALKAIQDNAITQAGARVADLGDRIAELQAKIAGQKANLTLEPTSEPGVFKTVPGAVNPVDEAQLAKLKGQQQAFLDILNRAFQAQQGQVKADQDKIAAEWLQAAGEAGDAAQAAARTLANELAKQMAEGRKAIADHLAALKELGVAGQLQGAEYVDALNYERAFKALSKSTNLTLEERADFLRQLTVVEEALAAQRKANLAYLQPAPPKPGATGFVPPEVKIPTGLDEHLAKGFDFNKIPPVIGDSAKNAKALEQSISKGVRGALQLADAFGLVDGNTQKILSGVNEAVSSAEALSSAIKAGSSGDIVSATIGIAGAIGSLISGLGGEDPNVKLLRDTEDKLNQSIQTLTAHFDSFQINLSGTAIDRAASGAAALNKLPGGFLEGSEYDALGDLKAGKKVGGASLQDLKDAFSQTVGGDLNTDNAAIFAQQIRALSEALKEAALAKFADTFAGQLDALQAKWQLLDITDPVAKLKDLTKDLIDFPRTVKEQLPNGTITDLQVGGHGSKAIADALGGLDLGNASDRTKALSHLEDLLQKLTEGKITTTDLGDLDPTQFKDEILQLGDLLHQANAQLDGRSQSFAEDRTITEVTGSEIKAILDTQLVYQQNLTVLPQILDVLSRMSAFIPVPAYPSSLLTGIGQGQTVVIQSLSVTVAVSPGDSPQAIGQAVGVSVVQGIDQALAARSAMKAAVRGAVLQ